ncbi:MAG: lipid-A-disaccharide synthase [Planctomycetes bacterium]|nr:lipid-A-disaccharide synthase [Planctomycetota bacterium]
MPAAPRLFLIAGEPSGDRLGAGLIQEARRLAPGARFTGLGGAEMRDAGCDLLADLAREPVMGVARVLARLPYFLRLGRDTEKFLLRERPDVVVPIDYPGFNLRLAARMRGSGVPFCYYVSPQVWAWKRGRVRAMARVLDKMLVLFPFEVPIYRAAGLPVEWVGHPIFDAPAAGPDDAAFLALAGARPGQRVIGVLPGSRPQEIDRNLDTMIRAAERLDARIPGMKYLCPAAHAALAAQIRPRLARSRLDHAVLAGRAHDVMRAARFCFVTSGTATLETFAFGAPMTIHYRVSRLTEALGRRLIATRHIGMVNILAGRELVPEFFGSRHSPDAMAAAAAALVEDGPRREAALAAMRALRRRVALPGASARAARAVLETAR